jgi:hypothetical protein
LSVLAVAGTGDGGRAQPNGACGGSQLVGRLWLSGWRPAALLEGTYF